MAAHDSLPILWQFKSSHYNEKVRWALDWKGIRYQRRSLLPGLHVPVVMLKTGQKQVPVLQIDGQTLHDSTRIIEALERGYAEPPLYPADPEACRRALELEEYFDTEIGPHVRRCLFHVALADPAFILALFTRDRPAWARAVYRAIFPLTRTLMRFDMGITDDGAARSLARLDAAIDRLERELQPSGYLAGDAFCVADLTAAALLTPITFPPQYPYVTPPLPKSVQDFQARFRERRGFRWALDMYALHRGASTGLDA